MSTGFRMEGDLKVGLDKLDTRVRTGMVAAANYVAPMALAHMRENAPWTDRTGAARNGLRTQVEVTPLSVAIVLYHTVPYGMWLEVRWGGKYAIIEPTIARMAPEFAKAVSRIVFD